MPQKKGQAYSWVSVSGIFDQVDDEIIFRGYDFTPTRLPLPVPSAADKGLDETVTEPPLPPPEPRGGVGQCMSNQRFTEGSVCVDVTFDGIDPNSTAEIILDFDPISS